jgi:creatinine amidohydrolase
MRKQVLMIFLLMASLSFVAQGQAKSTPKVKGVLLENLTWIEAQKILTPETVVVIPLGAASKEHGPHLKLKNDFLISEYLKNQTLQKADVVIAPTINYHFYPAFVEYPGSTTLRLETARDLVVDICRSLARYGVRRFYILNTGISTLRALKPAAEVLTGDGILMQYTDLQKLTGEVEKQVSRQEGGTHADEIETSMMLYIAPASVDMKKAVKDFHPSKGRGLTRDPNNKEGTYSATGIWGDPRLATREKGKKVIEALVTGILKDIEELRRASLPLPISKQN